MPNLMIGFGIDETQAEYVAEIKLRHLNREYILKRTEETGQLQERDREMESILDDPKKISKIIIQELQEVIKKYGQPRKSLLSDAAMSSRRWRRRNRWPTTRSTCSSPGRATLKRSPRSRCRMCGEHKLKEGDEVVQHIEAHQADRAALLHRQGPGLQGAAPADFEDTKASVLGDYIPAKLGMDDGENAVYMAVTADYQGYMLFCFENGKVAKVPTSTPTRPRPTARSCSTPTA